MTHCVPRESHIPPIRETRMAKKRPAKKPAAREVIQCWLTDPMSGLPPLQTTAPALPGTTLATRIVAPKATPAPRVYPTGSAEFRYWSAAEVLRRAAAFWSGVGNKSWNREVGSTLPVRLDDGVDLNAYYARTAFAQENIKQGLSFFHDTVRDASTGQQLTVFSGESPDV